MKVACGYFASQGVGESAGRWGWKPWMPYWGVGFAILKVGREEETLRGAVHGNS